MAVSSGSPFCISCRHNSFGDIRVAILLDTVRWWHGEFFAISGSLVRPSVGVGAVAAYTQICWLCKVTVLAARMAVLVGGHWGDQIAVRTL